MNNSWNLRGDATTYKKYEKGWANEEAKPKPIKRVPDQPVSRSGMMSTDNPLVNTHQYFKPAGSAARGSQSAYMHTMPPVVDYEEEKVKNEVAIKEYRAKQPPRDEF